MAHQVLRPTLDEVRVLAQEGTYRRVPVTRELYADAFTTIECLRALRAASNHVFLLESAEADQRWGRYSILGFDPTMEVTCLDGRLRVRTQVGTGHSKTTEAEIDHPGTYLREVLAAHRAPRIEGLPPFCGGLVGYFAYDYLKYAEPVLRRPQGSLGHEDFLDMDLMLFEKLVVFDAWRQKAVLIANARLDGAPVEQAYEEARAELDRMEELLRHGPHHAFEPLHVEGPLTPRLTRDEFCAMVDAAKDHILDGDIFQVVLSNPISAKATGSLLDTYRILRTTNPSPYMFYFTSDDMEFCGASPETLARLTDGVLHTFPLAGTRPRGATTEEDEALERELLADTKELAEHNMLVDLGRNDLGRIAEMGSVRVDDYLKVLRFSHVMHLGSTVSAAPARSSASSRAPSAASTAGPSATSTSPATSTPASASASSTRRRARSACTRAPASWPTAWARASTRSA